MRRKLLNTIVVVLWGAAIFILADVHVNLGTRKHFGGHEQRTTIANHTGNPPTPTLVAFAHDIDH